MTVRSVPEGTTVTDEARAAKLGRRLALDLAASTEGDQHDGDLVVGAVIEAGRQWPITQEAAMDLRQYVKDSAAELHRAGIEIDRQLGNIPRQQLLAQADATYAHDDGGQAERELPAELIERYEQEAEDR